MPCSRYSVVRVDVPSGRTCSTTRAGTKVGEGLAFALVLVEIPTTLAMVVKVTVFDRVRVTTIVRASAAPLVPMVYDNVLSS